VSGAILKKAMEMQAGTRIAQLVVEMDDNSITHRSCDGRDRPLTVDAHDGTFESTIRICPNPTNVEVISNSGGIGYQPKGQ